MCGIAGIAEADANAPPASTEVDRMLRMIEHRGPDGQGRIDRPGASLGHRRLAIIDLSDAAAQPFSNEDGTVFCSVNGEIYNHHDLRRWLESRGHAFRSRCDAEVVVHLYEELGAGCVDKLEGMFALAVWDDDNRRLLLARDRMGKKPVYWHADAKRIAFASEISALMASPSVPNEPDELALHHFLAFRFVPAPFTGFRQLRKLPAGHLLIWEHGRADVRRWWAPPDPPRLPEGALNKRSGGARDAGPRDEHEAAPALRSLLGAAVRRRLESDAPLGLLLSGGLDSSALAVEMAGAVGGAFQTFSVGFPDTKYDESPFAEAVARHVGADHHAVRVTPLVTESLPRLVLRYGEPFADSSAIAVEALARAVRPHVKVVLGGDGGDELLGGYDRYRALALADRLGPAAGALARPAARLLAALPIGKERRNATGRALRFAEALALPPMERNDAWLACFTEEDKHALYGRDLAGRMLGVDSFALVHEHMPPGTGAVDAAMRADLSFLLPDRMLFKLDGATMSVGLEARCPFLDTALIEWAARLPARLKLAGRGGKRILRAAYRDDLPREILARRKAGFGLPLDRWLRGPLREMAREQIVSGGLSRRGLFDPRALERIMVEHDSGARNHDDRIWTLICLETWFRTFIDSRPAPSTQAAPLPPTSAATSPGRA